MKTIISITFTGALSVFVLAWAFDAMGRIGYEEAAGHTAETGHEDADVLAGVAELAAAGSSGEFDGILAVDLADDDADDVRTRRSRRAMAELELTDEQQEKIKTLRSAYTREMIQLRADSRLARVELRELMNEISPDIERVKELATAASAAQGSVFERSALYRAEFKHVLTPEQQENLRESFRGGREGRLRIRDALAARWPRNAQSALSRCCKIKQSEERLMF